MAFPTTPILDDFNRADEGPPPSASWSFPITTNAGNGLGVSSNHLVPLPSNAESWYQVAYGGKHQEVYIDITDKSTAGVISLFVCIANPEQDNTADGYKVSVDIATQVGTIYRLDNAVATTLGSSFSFNPSNGDSIGIDANTTSIRYMTKTSGVWSEVASRSENTYRGGYLGVGIGGSLQVLDNFGGGTVSEPTELMIQMGYIGGWRR